MVATVTLATYSLGHIEKLSLRLASDIDSQGQPGGDYSTALTADLTGVILKINITGSHINGDGGMTNNAWLAAIMALEHGHQATNAGGGGNSLAITTDPISQYIQLTVDHAYVEDLIVDWENSAADELRYTLSLIAGTGL